MNIEFKLKKIEIKKLYQYLTYIKKIIRWIFNFW